MPIHLSGYCQLEFAMTRVDTRCSQVSIKQNQNSANLCRFLSAIVITLIVTVTYFLVNKPDDSLGDPSDQYVVKNIPKTYTRLESIDPDERDVFQGFRTSFLPPEEIVLARRDTKTKGEVYEGNVTSDIFIWGRSDADSKEPTRVKRMSHFTFTSDDSE